MDNISIMKVTDGVSDKIEQVNTKHNNQRITF